MIPLSLNTSIMGYLGPKSDTSYGNIMYSPFVYFGLTSIMQPTRPLKS